MRNGSIPAVAKGAEFVCPALGSDGLETGCVARAGEPEALASASLSARVSEPELLA
jgi:hypothetical protein